MVSASERNRQILPRLHDPLRSDDQFDPTAQLPPGLTTDASTSVRRRPKAQAKTDVEWGAQKEIVRELYLANDLKLEEVIAILDRDRGFQAS